MTLTVIDPLLLEVSADVQKDDEVTLGEWMTFSWVWPLVKLGYSKDLEDSEVPPLSRTMRTAETLETLKSTSGRSLLFKLLNANSYDIFLDVILTFLSVICNYASPYFIKRIIDAIASPTPEAKANAYIYAALALLASIAKATFDLFHLWAGRRNSVRCKSQLIALVYDKALKRKNGEGVTEEKEKASDKDIKGKDGKDAKKPKGKKDGKDDEKKTSADTGRIVSLMASDANRIAMTISGFYFIAGGVLEIPVAAVFLYNLLGYSAFVGFLFMVVASPLTSFFMKRYIKVNGSTRVQVDLELNDRLLRQITQEMAKARDKRITVMNEIIASIKFIKFFGWIPEFQKKALAARDLEMKIWIKVS